MDKFEAEPLAEREKPEYIAKVRRCQNRIDYA